MKKILVLIIVICCCGVAAVQLWRAVPVINPGEQNASFYDLKPLADSTWEICYARLDKTTLLSFDDRFPESPSGEVILNSRFTSLSRGKAFQILRRQNAENTTVDLHVSTLSTKAPQDKDYTYSLLEVDRISVTHQNDRDYLIVMYNNLASDPNRREDDSSPALRNAIKKVFFSSNYFAVFASSEPIPAMAEEYWRHELNGFLKNTFSETVQNHIAGLIASAVVCVFCIAAVLLFPKKRRASERPKKTKVSNNLRIDVRWPEVIKKALTGLILVICLLLTAIQLWQCIPVISPDLQDASFAEINTFENEQVVMQFSTQEGASAFTDADSTPCAQAIRQNRFTAVSRAKAIHLLSQIQQSEIMSFLRVQPVGYSEKNPWSALFSSSYLRIKELMVFRRDNLDYLCVFYENNNADIYMPDWPPDDNTFPALDKAVHHVKNAPVYAAVYSIEHEIPALQNAYIPADDFLHEAIPAQLRQRQNTIDLLTPPVVCLFVLVIVLALYKWRSTRQSDRRQPPPGEAN